MKNLLTKKNLTIFAIVSLLLLLVSFLYNPPVQLPTITATLPTQNSSKVNYFDNMNLQFDEIIDPTLIKISSTPEEDWSVAPGNSKDQVVVTSKQYLQVDTNYKLDIFYKEKPIHSLSFKTIAQQSDPRYAQSVMTQIARDYPLSTKTPLDTPNYHVVYTDTPLTLEITLKNKELLPSDAIIEVESWVTKNGGDASAHKFIIATP